MLIEIWSDINCPFCYIGKRHIEKALQSFNKEDIKIEWRSFELDPHGHPPKGSDPEELLANKYGKDKHWAKKMNENVTEMARRAGLDFHLEKMIPANSFDAHRLIHLAKVYGKDGDMKERFLAAKFIEGKDISDKETLLKLAFELDLSRDEAQDVLDSDRYAKDVRRDEELAMALGIRGVPYFIIDKKITLSGAQPPEMFLKALYEAKVN